MKPTTAKSKSSVKDDDGKKKKPEQDDDGDMEPVKKPALKRPAASQPKPKVQSKAKAKAKGHAGRGRLTRMETTLEKGLKVTLNRYKRDGTYGICLGEHEVLKAASLALTSVDRVRVCLCSISMFCSFEMGHCSKVSCLMFDFSHS